MRIVECPRDAMQGIKDFIPTKMKIDYINQLLKVGFDVVDFGSFVSPKAIPQLADTSEVLKGLKIHNSTSKLLSIVANVKGAEIAKDYDEIDFLGFPFSISETFQQRNTNSSIDQSLLVVEKINDICINSNKKLVVYLSMGFGNPYGDDWSIDILSYWSELLANQMGVEIQSLSDTIGVSVPSQITDVFQTLSSQNVNVDYGAHLHSSKESSSDKIAAAFKAGCNSFDTALNGIGGCPMAKDELVGNMSTQSLLSYFDNEGVLTKLNKEELQKSFLMADQLF
jgi:hydroxymethylglutaryl-CoA lyase